MKKNILFLILMNSYLVAYNQVIMGIVLDSKTKETIRNASIYFNGTFEGTSTDVSGNFTLDISHKTSIPIIVSSIGYYSLTLTDFSSDKPLIVYLTPKVYEINSVVVTSKSLVRKRKANIKLFREIFLGSTLNARHCEILNEKDISFNYRSDHDTLIAFASNPIIIHNRELGYKITYYLDKFEYYKKNFAFPFKGNIIFTQDLALVNGSKQNYDENRKNTYLRSRMHFFRSLWANNLIVDGFIVKNSDDVSINYENIVVEDDLSLPGHKKSLRKFLTCQKDLQLNFYSNATSLIFHKPKTYFDKAGYYDDLNISWEGAMIEKRIGDILPYEYELK